MKVFNHLLYEYEKGIRDLVLHTFRPSGLDYIIGKLENRNIKYLISKVNDKKYNIFFGSDACVEIVKHIGNKPLYQYTNEEDFILGIMLGYNRHDQCVRYLKTANSVKQLHT